jgi:hypothetical protein
MYFTFRTLKGYEWVEKILDEMTQEEVDEFLALAACYALAENGIEGTVDEVLSKMSSEQLNTFMSEAATILALLTRGLTEHGKQQH